MEPLARTPNEELIALQVIDQQEPLRFLVQSRSRMDVVHLVDLEEYWQSGRCSCENFTFQIEPLLRRLIVRPNTPRAWCKHIRCAREVVVQAAIRAVAKHREMSRHAHAA